MYEFTTFDFEIIRFLIWTSLWFKNLLIINELFGHILLVACACTYDFLCIHHTCMYSNSYTQIKRFMHRKGFTPNPYRNRIHNTSMHHSLLKVNDIRAVAALTSNQHHIHRSPFPCIIYNSIPCGGIERCLLSWESRDEITRREMASSSFLPTAKNYKVNFTAINFDKGQ